MVLFLDLVFPLALHPGNFFTDALRSVLPLFLQKYIQYNKFNTYVTKLLLLSVCIVKQNNVP